MWWTFKKDFTVALSGSGPSMSTALIWVGNPIITREARCSGDGIFLEAHVEHVL